ncbi:MAG TPA: hypothetical protein VNT42_06335 [Sphingomonas sp.]|nr:hypothetical protein [Sphingomonas sp.]
MKALVPLFAISLATSGAMAGNSLIVENAAVAVAKSGLTVRPDREWNKLGARPGRNSETWTIDGDTLNDLTFYGGIEDGKTLFREVDRHNKPLPRFSATMLLTDIPSLVENSYRIALGTSLMTIDKVEPARLGSRNGIRFEYSFVRQGEDLHRRGEGYATTQGGKLYMITFEAPALYYFDADVGAARQVVASVTLPKSS